jgi:IS4 transposase
MTKGECIKYFKSIQSDIFEKVCSLQKRKRVCNVSNLFNTMIYSSFGDNKECNFSHLYKSNRYLAESTRSYWRSKIYDLSFDFNEYSYATNNNIINNAPVPIDFKHIYDKYNLLAIDLTKTKTAYRNKSGKGKNLANVGISAMFNIRNQLFPSYNVTNDNNEINGLLEHNLSKKDLIILDRYYASYELFDKLKKKTNFIVRLKKNLKVVKNFIKSSELSKTTNIEGTRLKLVKYWIDKTTKKIIYDKYSEEGTLSEEDQSDCFILATNLTDLSIDECIYIYKKRWDIEIAFKQLKQNFRIRYPCQTIRSKQPLKKCLFWYMMSFLMFNLSSILKNIIDTDNNINCKFSDCARFVRLFLIGKIKMRDVNDEINKINKNRYTKIYTKIYTREIKAGTLKSINKINSINELYNEHVG